MLLKRPRMSTASAKKYLLTHMRSALTGKDCFLVTIQNPFLTVDEIGHNRMGRSEDDVSSAF